MADQRTMAQLLQAPTEGYEDAIVVPEMTTDNFEFKHGHLTLVQNKQFYGHDKEDPYAHIRYFNKIASTLKFPNVLNTSIKLMLFPFSLKGAARIWLEKEPPQSIFSWDDLVLKFINKFFLLSKTSNLRNEITNFQQRFDESFNQDSLNFAIGGNFLDKMPRECLSIIESKSKVRYSCDKPVVAKVSTNASTSGVSPNVAELKDMVKALLLDKKCMQTHSSSLVSNPSSNPTLSINPNPKGRNRRRSKQIIKEFNLEELSPPIVTMTDQRTMAQLLQAPTKGYEDAIVVPTITADNFELKHGLLTLVQNKKFFGHDKEDPHAHIRYFNKITSTLKFSNVPNTLIKLMPFPFSLEATDGNVYRDNIQEFVSQAPTVNYNQGNTSYRPPMMSNQI
nr:reverse transcriptase domain-containing protein [Tanacetum cinerariifolium]